MSHEDVLEEKMLHRNEGSGSAPPYKPPPQFKEVNTPPLLPEFAPDTVELWLVRIQDNQLKADEFKGKCVSLALNASGGQMGCFEDTKGSSFEILDLHNVAGVQPFAFVPKGDSSLEVKRVSRQVAIVRSLDPVAISRPSPKMDHLSLKLDGRSNVNTPQKQKHAPSILHGGISSRGTRSEVKQESHAVSGTLSFGAGGRSTVESLQEDEEKISFGKLGKSSKKSRRGPFSMNSEVELSPHTPSHKDLEVLDKPSKKKKRDHSGLNSEVQLSQHTLSYKNLEAQEKQASSKKISRKHKKKQEESG
ncbi:hypothetical protein L7F22_009820 [Adiantum nelumboides]|nr:hypothetical protein [Adiantum nelumboides]